MKMLKKAAALILAVVFIFSLTACHQKDEVAVWSGDYKLTSAMYSYFLVMADSEAKSLIDSDEKYDTKAANFSYYKQEIDGKSFEAYVKELAMEKCLKYLVLEKLCDEADITLDEETAKGWKETAEYYWNYSVGEILTENGVAYSTYEKIRLNDALYSRYFNYLYDDGGVKEVADKEIQSALDKNYAAVYMITHDYSEEEKPDVKAIEEKLGKYVTLLKDGKDFDEVLKTYNNDNGIKEDTTTSSTTTTSSAVESGNSSANNSSDNTSSDKEEEKKPLDENITVLTGYEETYTGEATFFDKFEDVKKMEQNAVQLIHNEDEKCFYVVVKKDINADKYYIEELKEEILYLLKSDEYDKHLDDTAKDLDYEVSKYAINQFKVKKIFDGTEK